MFYQINCLISTTFKTNGKRQKWNFCHLSSAPCTVESKHLYLQWIVRDTFLFLYDLFKDTKKRIENQTGNFSCLPSAVTSCLTMVSQMLQNSTTCTFIFNKLYLCSTRYIYIQHFIFIFNNTHFLSTSTKLFSFNKSNYSTSTKIICIQQI